MPCFPDRFRLSLSSHWPGPRSLATTSGVSVDVLSSGYLDVSVPRVCLVHAYVFSMHDTPCGVGSPIRKFTDQSLFAAPRNLSQRTTSFIASQRQGIHRMPFFHLITLIIDARHARRATNHRRRFEDPATQFQSRHARILVKTSFFFEIRSGTQSRSLANFGDRPDEGLPGSDLLFSQCQSTCQPAFPVRSGKIWRQNLVSCG